MDRKQGNRRLDIQKMDRVEDNRKLDTAGAEELKNQDPDRDLMWELVRSEHLVKDEWMDFPLVPSFLALWPCQALLIN